MDKEDERAERERTREGGGARLLELRRLLTGLEPAERGHVRGRARGERVEGEEGGEGGGIQGQLLGRAPPAAADAAPNTRRPPPKQSGSTEARQHHTHLYGPSAWLCRYALKAESKRR